jgi:hypothetical protein
MKNTFEILLKNLILYVAIVKFTFLIKKFFIFLNLPKKIFSSNQTTPRNSI